MPLPICGSLYFLTSFIAYSHLSTHQLILVIQLSPFIDSVYCWWALINIQALVGSISSFSLTSYSYTVRLRLNKSFFQGNMCAKIYLQTSYKRSYYLQKYFISRLQYFLALSQPFCNTTLSYIYKITLILKSLSSGQTGSIIRLCFKVGLSRLICS